MSARRNRFATRPTAPSVVLHCRSNRTNTLERRPPGANPRAMLLNALVLNGSRVLWQLQDRLHFRNSHGIRMRTYSTGSIHYDGVELRFSNFQTGGWSSRATQLSIG